MTASQTPQPAPTGDGGLADAQAYVRDQRDRYTHDAIADQLRIAGYAESVVAEAMLEFDRPEGAASNRDLRNRATAILVVTFLGTWLILTLLLLGRDDMYGVGQIASMILGVLLGIVLLLSLAYVRGHRKLAAGVEGALVSALTVPFIFWFAITGLCVATVNPFAR